MKAKLLLLFCFLFVIEGWVSAYDICLQRKVGSNPTVIPIQPPSDKCAILCNILNINFDRMESYATITITNTTTGEIVYYKVCHNVNFVTINMSSYNKGKYSIHITLEDRILEGSFTV